MYNRVGHNIFHVQPMTCILPSIEGPRSTSHCIGFGDLYYLVDTLAGQSVRKHTIIHLCGAKRVSHKSVGCNVLADQWMKSTIQFWLLDFIHYIHGPMRCTV